MVKLSRSSIVLGLIAVLATSSVVAFVRNSQGGHPTAATIVPSEATAKQSSTAHSVPARQRKGQPKRIDSKTKSEARAKAKRLRAQKTRQARQRAEHVRKLKVQQRKRAAAEAAKAKRARMLIAKAAAHATVTHRRYTPAPKYVAPPVVPTAPVTSPKHVTFHPKVVKSKQKLNQGLHPDKVPGKVLGLHPDPAPTAPIQKDTPTIKPRSKSVKKPVLTDTTKVVLPPLR